MLRVSRSSNGEVLFVFSGRIRTEHIAELETLIHLEGHSGHILIDLKDVTLAGEDAITFLARCEAKNIILVNCPAYIREWVTRKRELSGAED